MEVKQFGLKPFFYFGKLFHFLVEFIVKRPKIHIFAHILVH